MDATGALTVGFAGFSAVVLRWIVHIGELVCTIWEATDAAKSRVSGDLYKLRGQIVHLGWFEA
jgi:hypothetical protein